MPVLDFDFPNSTSSTSSRTRRALLRRTEVLGSKEPRVRRGACPSPECLREAGRRLRGGGAALQDLEACGLSSPSETGQRPVSAAWPRLASGHSRQRGEEESNCTANRTKKYTDTKARHRSEYYRSQTRNDLRALKSNSPIHVS